MNTIILGLGFGDEGKGQTVSDLIEKYKDKDKYDQSRKTAVVRFNGGHQAGHTVIYGGRKHIFSNFGSGTLQGVPTYWSKYCTIHPTAMLREQAALMKIEKQPILFIDPLCPVTTPYDIAWNRIQNRDGSCGVGFGATIQRQEDHYNLYMQDLQYKDIFFEKMRNIRDYYIRKTSVFTGEDETQAYNVTVIPAYWEIVGQFLRGNFYHVVDDEILNDYNLIFEGAQGILLDQDFGFFPNVTRSNTTSKNALEIIKSLVRNANPTEIIYVTRPYQTRHGKGFMSDCSELKLENVNETNTGNYQGSFRVGRLDRNLLSYALKVDKQFSKDLQKSLKITCLDQTKNNILLRDGETDPVELGKLLGVGLLGSDSV